VPIGSLLRFFNGTSQVGFFSRSTTNKQSIATQLHEPNYAEGKQCAIVTVVYDYTKYTFIFILRLITWRKHYQSQLLFHVYERMAAAGKKKSTMRCGNTGQAAVALLVY